LPAAAFSGGIEGRPIGEYNGELSLQHRQRFVHNRPNAAQRMIAPHPRLEIDITEQLARPFVPAAHSSTSESLRRH
jgi:hypothetical protein